jgi:hypothetical protein
MSSVNKVTLVGNLDNASGGVCPVGDSLNDFGPPFDGDAA